MSAHSDFVQAIRRVVQSMLPNPQVQTCEVTRVTIRGGVVTAVEVRDIDGNLLPCDFADSVATAALAGSIVGRSAVVLFAGAPIVTSLYRTGDR